MTVSLPTDNIIISVIEFSASKQVILANNKAIVIYDSIILFDKRTNILNLVQIAK